MIEGTKTGYCKLCRSEYVAVINKAISDGLGFSRALTEAKRFDVTFSKGTFLRHKDHVTSPIVTEAAAARQNPILPKTNRGVIESIRDAGLARVLENPELIKTGDVLRAAKLIQDDEKKGEAIFVVLAKAVQEDFNPDVIEGSYKELE